MRTPRLRRTCACLVSLLVLSASTLIAQSTGGRFIGQVSDPSGAVLAGVQVTLVNEASGVSRTTTTNESGDFSFLEAPVGTYRFEFDLAGFKNNIRRGVLLQLNQVVTVNMTMQVGERREVVEVTSSAPLVDTTSTQLGAVINDRSIAQLPLNERDTYQFLSLQPGVQSQLGADLYVGSDNAGSVSVNGGRGRANNFSVNGGDANDLFANLPTVQPSPDAVEEFRILTNAFDAEYGRNSGSVVNVVTKSGTNQFHGNVYEFFRNKVLNSKGYFDTSKGKFNQNQFGGTLGGPIRKDKTFFFGSYEGRRVRRGRSGDQVAVPTSLERAGDFSLNSDGSAADPFGGVINDDFAAQVLNGRPGCSAAISTAGGSSPAAGVDYASIFPGNMIPTACQDPVATDLLRFVPGANTGNGFYQAVLTNRDRQDQATMRFDHRINDKQNFSAYYYFTDQAGFEPFNNFQAAGANVPGFGASRANRYQQINLSHTWSITNSIVNEARFTYMREGQRTYNHPEKTNLVVDSCGPAAAAFCFTGLSDSSAVNALPNAGPKFGITPGLGAGSEGVPDITIAGGFTIGNNFEGELPQVGNSFQGTDSLTVVKGTHTMKFGGDVRRMRFDQTLYFEPSGYYNFFGGGNNDVGYANNLYPNYLLGLPDTYQQGAAQQEHVRGTAVYLFAQDSWKIRHNLTLNYGLRWELNTPLKDIGKRVQTFRPGQNTSIFPCDLSAESQALLGTSDCTSVFPAGLVVPGDSGVPAGLTQTYYKAFAPRLGIAWDPRGDGKTSIRAGWGLFYNPIEQLVLEQFSAEPPFGVSIFLANTLFNTPFVTQGGGVNPNGANGILDPKRGSAVDWSVYRPILLFGEFQPHMRTQYSAQYNLTLQHEVSRDLELQLSYVGSQGHRLLATRDLNAANPQTCLDIIAIQGDGACGQFAEDNPYSVTVPNGFTFHLPNGTTVPGTGQTLNFVGLRPYSSPNCQTDGTNCPADGVPVFSNIFAQDTIANSNYNSLQASLEKRFSHGLQAQLAYTWSKSIDQASSFEDILNPFDPLRTRGLSLYDARHRFVVSYYWEPPIPKYNGFAGKALNGWAVSGITQLQAGFPIHIQSYDDQELTSSIDFSSAGVPDLVAPYRRLDPRKNLDNLGFDPSSFAPSALGTFGNSPRSVCCGPGLDNWDVSLQKNTGINERFRTEFRVDFFNVANHTKFFNPDGNITDGSDFGRVKRAADPRLVQLALKLFF